MSNNWFTRIGPSGWSGVLIDNNNPKSDATFKNIFSGSGNLQLAAPSYLFIGAKSGVRIFTEGKPVDASGYRGIDISAIKFNKIDISGNIIPMYSGATSGLVYKISDSDLGSVPDLIYNQSIQKTTFPSGAVYNPLYLSFGTGTVASKEIDSYDYVYFKNPVTGVNSSPATVQISGLLNTSGIQIGPNQEYFAGSILTHQGENKAAAWRPASYLNADGMLWNRYPKRPVRIETNRIIFYTEKPDWSIDDESGMWDNVDIEQLTKEYGLGSDTIALINNETRETIYVKFAVSITFPAIDNDPNTEVESPFEEVTFTDSEGEQQGIAVEICPDSTFDNPTLGYAFSVTKGAYMSMQLEPEATDNWNCGSPPFDDSPYTFKPSTSNLISIRPNINTSFNMLGENIDFLVFGKVNTAFNNYDEALFGLDENSQTPTGIVPGLMVDANVNNAVIGDAISGVKYTKYLDRAKTIPSGYVVDFTPKVLINTKSPYSLASIVSGTETLNAYASLTVSGYHYADSLIAQNIFVRPLPTSSSSGLYITNSLLTVNNIGQIVSRKPTVNPKVPGKPTSLSVSAPNGVDGNTDVSLYWIAPTDNGGSDIIQYNIEFSINSGSTWTSLPTSPYILDRAFNNQTSVTVKGLSTGPSYIFRVYAQNSVGVGPASDNSLVCSMNTTVPSSPNNLSTYRAFDSSISEINLSWSAPTHNGSSSVSGYVIEESENSGITWSYYNSPSSLIVSTSETIYGVNSESNYLYRISAYNASGHSSYSFIYSSGNAEVIPEEDIDAINNWDFGTVLFTGVCLT